ncbi:hypothetical protein Q8A67_020267 [Cirrhinus molitorella]|uniref:Uncharacterized protein n=1 Tax=Cirrhinus molitorella TaxID=172907 RepID=A0AA88TGT4_9TELE|nr:hypothetical protein Q8A67_020267 [Cirrhinus molitorella]
MRKRTEGKQETLVCGNHKRRWEGDGERLTEGTEERRRSVLANLHSMLEEALTLSDSKAVMEIYAQAPRTEQGKGGGV